MKTKDAILDHLKYGLTHVDGVRWLCAQVVAWLVEEYVYKPLGNKREIPKPWTAS